ncbi:MAG: hypothetical protein F4147_04665 [Gammaproteobacteria bacterium]|nr:hypothetical protein [Gammaproteobacteria bacterium]
MICVAEMDCAATGDAKPASSVGNSSSAGTARRVERRKPLTRQDGSGGEAGGREQSREAGALTGKAARAGEALRRSGTPALRHSGTPALRHSGDYSISPPGSICQAQFEEFGKKWTAQRLGKTPRDRRPPRGRHLTATQ